MASAVVIPVVIVVMIAVVVVAAAGVFAAVVVVTAPVAVRAFPAGNTVSVAVIAPAVVARTVIASAFRFHVVRIGIGPNGTDRKGQQESAAH